VPSPASAASTTRRRKPYSVPELLRSEVMLFAATLAGLALTSLAIVRDVRDVRARQFEA
jgi:hypothetical protein